MHTFKTSGSISPFQSFLHALSIPLILFCYCLIVLAFRQWPLPAGLRQLRQKTILKWFTVKARSHWILLRMETLHGTNVAGNAKLPTQAEKSRKTLMSKVRLRHDLVRPIWWGDKEEKNAPHRPSMMMPLPIWQHRTLPRTPPPKKHETQVCRSLFGLLCCWDFEGPPHARPLQLQLVSEGTGPGDMASQQPQSGVPAAAVAEGMSTDNNRQQLRRC